MRRLDAEVEVVSLGKVTGPWPVEVPARVRLPHARLCVRRGGYSPAMDGSGGQRDTDGERDRVKAALADLNRALAAFFEVRSLDREVYGDVIDSRRAELLAAEQEYLAAHEAFLTRGTPVKGGTECAEGGTPGGRVPARHEMGSDGDA